MDGPLEAAFNERFKESDVPLSADPEARLNDGACAKAYGPKRKRPKIRAISELRYGDRRLDISRQQ